MWGQWAARFTYLNRLWHKHTVQSACENKNPLLRLGAFAAKHHRPAMHLQEDWQSEPIARQLYIQKHIARQIHNTNAYLHINLHLKSDV